MHVAFTEKQKRKQIIVGGTKNTVKRSDFEKFYLFIYLLALSSVMDP